jgi:CHASE2 domain-containing sensor protein
MTPVPEWRRILKHAWSVRLMLLSAALSAASAALMFGGFLPIPPEALFLLILVVNLAATVARFMAQKQFKVQL